MGCSGRAGALGIGIQEPQKARKHAPALVFHCVGPMSCEVKAREMGRKQTVGAVCKWVHALIGRAKIWPDAVRKLRSDISQPRSNMRFRYRELPLYAIAIASAIALYYHYTAISTKGWHGWASLVAGAMTLPHGGERRAGAANRVERTIAVLGLRYTRTL